MKILLFGGAFDPPHLGHAAILKKAAGYTNFDKILVVPTGSPTHKKGCVAPFDVRLYMAKLAFENIGENVEISDYEGTNFKDDYTYITLKHIKQTYGDPQIYMLIGSDSLFSLDGWKNSQYIMQNCSVLAFAREENIADEISRKITQLTQAGWDVRFIPDIPVQCSSSGYREDDENFRHCLSDSVREIIDEYNIYSDNDVERYRGTAKLLAKLLLDEKRCIHTLNVEKLAVELGEIHGVDTDKLSVAALLHDIMKNAPDDILLHRAAQSDIIDKIKDKPRQTLHGFAAADYAKKELGIADEDILWAVKSHTCGRSGMQDMEKIIYLADMLCEERRFEQKDFLLEHARKNLDMAMYLALGHSLEYVKSRGNTVDEDSISALEYFKSRLNL